MVESGAHAFKGLDAWIKILRVSLDSENDFQPRLLAWYRVVGTHPLLLHLCRFRARTVACTRDN
ncbi:hypothetical protein H5410_046887 [Solanum commersonii]|uniref:Uncharacterized protein n=1 Tax=Solanum commersonii TaxID=4109 RepID=A0A9J5XFJ2_SOLCO|nr:hypothetical protein H5410_046887 [Solanum commersonii]